MRGCNALWIILCIVCLSGWGGGEKLSAQSSFDEEFESFQQLIEEEWGSYKDSINRDFARFLEQSWQEFSVHEGTEPIAYAKGLAADRQVAADSDKVFGCKESPDLFWGQTVDLPFVALPAIPLHEASEKQVASGWLRLSDSGLQPLLKTCVRYRGVFRLNDWGYFSLLQYAIEKGYTSISTPQKTMLLFYLLNQSGYKAKIARTGDTSLALLLPFAEEVYHCPYIYIEKQKFYLWDAKGTSPARLYTFVSDYREADRVVSLSLLVSPILNGGQIHQKLTDPHKKTVTISLNKHLLDFYASWPLCELPVYFNAALSDSFEQGMESLFLDVLSGKTVYGQIVTLLEWVQHSFIHKPDQEVHGKEVYYFPDEVLYYPYTDCEDLSILLTSLIRHFTQQEILALFYQDHVAIAVESTTGYKGALFRYEEKDYFICDPSYKGAAPGKVIPACGSQQPVVIKITNADKRKD